VNGDTIAFVGVLIQTLCFGRPPFVADPAGRNNRQLVPMLVSTV
jgi:hypothetical protein